MAFDEHRDRLVRTQLHERDPDYEMANARLASPGYPGLDRDGGDRYAAVARAGRLSGSQIGGGLSTATPSGSLPRLACAAESLKQAHEVLCNLTGIICGPVPSTTGSGPKPPATGALVDALNDCSDSVDEIASSIQVCVEHIRSRLIG